MCKPTITFQQVAAACKLLAKGNRTDAIVMRAVRKKSRQKRKYVNYTEN